MCPPADTASHLGSQSTCTIDAGRYAWQMKAPLTSGLSLVTMACLLMTQSPADAERPKPRRAHARSAMIRHAATLATQPAPSLDVGAGCVPVWVVVGRETRRLPDRCPVAAAVAVAPAARTPPTRTSKKKPPATCARFRTWVDANGVRRQRPLC